jgi:hypothetical protein
VPKKSDFLEKSSTEGKIGFLKNKSDFDLKSDFSTEEKLNFLKKKSDFDLKSEGIRITHYLLPIPN